MRRLKGTIFLLIAFGFFLSAYLVQAAPFHTWWGNVGIGKVPVSNLDIIGGNNSTGVVNSTSLCLAGDCKTSWAQVSGGGLAAGISGQTLRNNGTGWATSSLLFNTGTYIGINTTNPQALLNVYATSTIGSVPAPPTSQTYNNTTVGYTGTIQTWTVPVTGTYTIEAWGAEGGTPSSYPQYPGGKGARMKGDFALTAGEVIKILVGQKGGFYTNEGMGGGGTFVVKQTGNVPLIVAGGGGGGDYNATYGPGMDAVTGTSGTYDRSNSCPGGSSGNGGTACGGGGAGAGFSGNGPGGSCGILAYSYLNGGNGSNTGISCTGYGAGASGGFGGGGGTHGGTSWGGGGGGGYSGGGGGTSNYGGGGGGSYNAGTNQSNTPGVQTGHGKVVITSPGVGTIEVTVKGKAANFDGNVSVLGGLKLGDSGLSCDAQSEGSLKYSTSTRTFLGCNGTNWLGIISGNTTPDAFSFTYQSNLNPNTVVNSNIVQINGIISVSVSVSGSGSPQFRTCSDSSCASVIQDWTTSASIANGKYLQLRQTTSLNSLGTNMASVAVGTSVVSWSVSTGMTTPNAFSFTVPAKQALNTVINSSIALINGLGVNSAVVVGGDGAPQFRICSDSACNTVSTDWSATSSNISNSKYLQLRATTPNSPNATTTATVTLGTSTVPFYLPTGSDLVNAFSFSNSTSVYPNAISASAPVQITGNTIPAGITVTGGGSPYVRVCTDAACNNLASQQTYNNSSTGQTGTQYTWTVPANGTYTIEAWGAQGGYGTSYSYVGGKGARMRGDFYLNVGEVIKILVGQQGGSPSYDGMGGGGTFVVKQTGNVPLIVAGGGGGSSGDSANSAGMDASITTTSTSNNGGQCPGVAGPNGGSACSNASGGGGFSTNGGSGSGGFFGYSYLNGANGGSSYYSVYGGYGGGGGTHGGGWGGGGGGGYAGGSAYTAGYGGGGGGSYNNGSNQSNAAGVQVGHGKVVISSPSSTITAGQYIQVLLRASQSNNTPTTATVNIGSTPISASYTATTGSATVSAFSFTDVTGQAKNAVISSNIVQITTSAAVGVSVDGNASPQFRVCSTSNCSSVVTDWTNVGNISNGQYLQVRLTSSISSLTAVSTNVSVGSVTDNWSVTTWNQYDPTNISLSHTANYKNFTISWTAGLNNGGAGGCKLQFMDQNVSGLWKDITGTSLNCDTNVSNLSINLQESITTSWTGTHQIRLFILNTNLAGPTFPQTLSCSSIGASYGTATPNIDENCNGQFDDSAVWYTYEESCSNQGSSCTTYQTYDASNCVGNITYSYPYGWCGGSPFCSTWSTGSNYYYNVGDSRSNNCIWDENVYYYY